MDYVKSQALKSARKRVSNMAAINTVTLIGRVVRDIEVNSTNSGKSVASFALAVDGYGKDADASFIDCVAWNKAAELLAEYAPKGKQIGISYRGCRPRRAN